MRAVMCKEYGLPDTLCLEDLPAKHPGTGEVVVQVKAAGVNFHDALMVQGLFQRKPQLPFSPGADFAGLVKEIGPGVTRVRVGNRVLGTQLFGAYAEEVLIGADQLVELPDGVDFVSAAGIGMTYTTSYCALKNYGHLAKGETLLVLGAAGGVGTAAVELGRIMGARVIACAAADDKLEICRKLGAHETVNYVKEDLRERLDVLTQKRGVDVVCDPVGDTLAESALKALAPRGRHLIIGFASGKIPNVAFNALLLRGASLIGVSRGKFMEQEPDESKKNIDQLLTWLAERKLNPFIGAKYPLERAATALNDIMSRAAAGKIVLTI